MKRAFKTLIALILALTAVLSLAACENKTPEATIRLSVDGETKEIHLVLYRKYAPVTVANFIKLAKEGYYDGMCVTDITSSYVKAGDYALKEEDGEGDLDYGLTPAEPRDTIKGEFYNNGWVVQDSQMNARLKHVRGAISMYRADADVYNSASTAFMLMSSANASMDRNYAVFGLCKDEASRKVIDELAALETATWTDPDDEDTSFALPITRVVILSIKIKD